MNKEKIVRLYNLKSSEYLNFELCRKLKMNGWQFNKLSIEESLLKWLKNNIDKNLKVELYIKSTLTEIRMEKRHSFNLRDMPINYDLGDPNNRWIHQEFISITEEENKKQEKELNEYVASEYTKIELILNSINKIKNINIMEV